MGKWFAINRIDAIDNPASFVVGKMQVIGLRSFAALLETGSSMDRSVFYDGVAYELRRRKSELHIDAEIRPASLRYVSEWLVQQLTAFVGASRPIFIANTQPDVHLTDMALSFCPIVERPWRRITQELPFWYVM